MFSELVCLYARDRQVAMIPKISDLQDVTCCFTKSLPFRYHHWFKKMHRLGIFYCDLCFFFKKSDIFATNFALLRRDRQISEIIYYKLDLIVL